MSKTLKSEIEVPSGNGIHLHDSPSLPHAWELARKRPIALLALVPRPIILFSAGALSGALARSLTAPLDRVKILLQVRGGMDRGPLGVAAARGRFLQSLAAIGREEGFRGYWKGNIPQVLKVIPHSATQLYSYELFKDWFRDRDDKLTVWRRLAAGACAGMVATLVTFPLDTLRLRMAVDPNCKTMGAAIVALSREGSGAAFYRGLGASLAGIAPYMALELAMYDILPPRMPVVARGFTAAAVATLTCYPLDTMRRYIQLQAGSSVAVGAAARHIFASDGIPGFYRGFIPSNLKNLPNKSRLRCIFECAVQILRQFSLIPSTPIINNNQVSSFRSLTLPNECWHRVRSHSAMKLKRSPPVAPIVSSESTRVPCRVAFNTLSLHFLVASHPFHLIPSSSPDDFFD